MRLPDLTCLTYASEAYSAPPDIVAGDVQAILRDLGYAMVVGFKGTDPANIRDWIRDLDALPIYHSQLGYCHRGFLTGAEAALPLLLAKLPKDKPVLLIGHSLGGALAIDTTALLVLAGITPLQCTTFGAPRTAIGAELGQVIAQVPGDRWDDGNDPVPGLPPGFAHDRKLTQIGTQMLDPIDAHMLDRYQKELVAYLGAQQNPLGTT